MATYTVGDQIKRALRLLGVLAGGENPSSSEYSDALMVLIQMLDSWSTESLSVYQTLDQTFTWPAGQATRTLGPTGDFVGVRPVLLDGSTYFIVNGISYPVIFVSEQAYNAIPDKAVTSTMPLWLHVNPTYPDAEITLYPVPTQDLTFHFISAKALDEPIDTSTELLFPPGYLRAFAYNLAVELAPEFGVEPSRQVQRIAVTSKRNIKRINQSDDVLLMPGAIVNRRYGFNIYAGDA